LRLAGKPNTISSGNVVSKIPFTRGVSIEFLDRNTNTYYSHSGFGSGNLQDELGSTTRWWTTYIPNGYTIGITASNRLLRIPPGASNVVLDAPGGYNWYQNTNTNYRHRIQWDSLNNINCYRDNTLVLSATNNVYAAGNKFLHFTQGEYSDGRGGDRYMDWVFVRKYSVNEPFVSGWG